MKRTLSFMVMALALLLTQCRKPEVKFPTPSSAEGVTVSMTVTAGPGSKTDITDAGVITWSSGDKLYVGDGEKYIGFLTLVGDGGSATGTFTGNVTLTGITEGIPQTFHFFYLGSAERTLEVGATTVDVDFSSQNIYADVNNKADVNKKLVNASAQHVGYGSANGTVTNGAVTGINVTMVSKVAIAYFYFKDGTTPYTDELTLSGSHIYNKMRVNFNSTGFDCEGIKGDISLAGGHEERYVMLVPTSSTTGSQTLNFGGGASGITTLANGIEANKFYGKTEPIPVNLTAPSYLPGDFTVSSGVTVKFSRGNLYAKKTGTKWEWGFYEHQYDMNSLNSGDSRTATSVDAEIDLFTWGYGDWSTNPVGTTYQTGSDATMTDWGGITDLPDNAGGNTWRTLSNDEWKYLLNTSNASSGARTDANRFAKAKVNGVKGMLIFPDRYNGGTAIVSITGVAAVNSKLANYPAADIPKDTWISMETAGVVFLPAAGYRSGAGVFVVGVDGNYWSSTANGKSGSYRLGIDYSNVYMLNKTRGEGYSVRLVLNAS